MYINYSDLPGFNNLFLDYLYEFDNVKKFYKYNFRNSGSFNELFKELSEKKRHHRSRLVQIIESQYSGYQISKITEQNISYLNNSNTIAIITGQQLGLFGGPLYTFYKIITAIKLNSYLKDNFEGYNFVPVFWLEGDDHDFDEVRYSTFLNDGNEPFPIEYSDGLSEEINRGSVSDIVFGENLNHSFDQLNSLLRDTDFKAEVMQFLKMIYRKGKSFENSFRELLHKFFDDFGLVIYSPHDRESKKLLTPIFSKEIKDFKNNSNVLIERSAELEETYHAQVKVKPINMFYQNSEGRFSIEPSEEKYTLKGKRITFEKDEIMEELITNPQNFSPSVLLRPICQDYLFPTGFYVGGPSEISYFAQVMPLYQIFNVTAPIIYPRAGATIIEQSVKKTIDGLSLSYFDVFNEEKLITGKVISQVSEYKVEELFKLIYEKVDGIIGELERNLSGIDKTLLDPIEKTKQKIVQSLDNLKGRALSAEERKYQTEKNKIIKIKNNIFPKGSLQEREINFFYFANKYGIDIVNWIFNELNIHKFEHQIMEL